MPIAELVCMRIGVCVFACTRHHAPVCVCVCLCSREDPCSREPGIRKAHCRDSGRGGAASETMGQNQCEDTGFSPPHSMTCTNLLGPFGFALRYQGLSFKGNCSSWSSTLSGRLCP